MKKRKDSPKQEFEPLLIDKAMCKTIVNNLYDGVYVVDKDKKIIYWNKAAEQLTGFKAREVIGRRCTQDVICHLDKKGAQICMTKLCPLGAVFSKGKTIEDEFYVRHKDGHRVYILSRIVPLSDPQGDILGAIALLTENTREMIERKRSEQLRRKAYFDQLTELGNRRYGEASIISRLNELKRYGWPFGLIFADIDRFKPVNDRFGHQIGDRVLKMVANTLQKSARPFDIFARWGGEEFIGIIVNIKEADLFIVADRFRALVEQSSFTEGKDIIKVTISIGATIAEPGDTANSIVERADKLMYHSKEAGRNRVSMK